MKMPLLSPPVKRPELIHPYETVDLVHGTLEDLVALRMDLLHGANFNDPPPMQHRSYQYMMTM